MTFDKQYISHANGIFNVKQNIQHIQITRCNIAVSMMIDNALTLPLLVFP